MIPRAADHLERLISSLRVRTVYADLDGTLLGPGGSLFSHPDGPTGEPAEAVAAMARAGVGLVPVSGRTIEQTGEVARILGATAFVAELGGVLVHREGRRETVTRLTGAYRGPGTPVDAIARSGAGGLLLDAFAGRLEPHTPWSLLPRETSLLLRGNIDVPSVLKALERAGLGWLDIVDNGIISRDAGRFPSLALGPREPVRAYHLVPRGVSKRAAVAADRKSRNLPRDTCIAVGDAESDARMADEVGAVFLVSNAEAAVDGAELPANVYLLARSYGLGFVDAVMRFLGEPRGT